MSPDELHARFVAAVETRGIDDKYIDSQEEREILQIGVQHGYDTERARTALVQACQDRGYVIEAAIVRRVRDQLRTVVDSKGRIDRGGFESVVREARNAIGGTTRTDSDVRRLILTTMNDSGLTRVKTGWFTNWHRRMCRQLGV